VSAARSHHRADAAADIEVLSKRCAVYDRSPAEDAMAHRARLGQIVFFTGRLPGEGIVGAFKRKSMTVPAIVTKLWKGDADEVSLVVFSPNNISAEAPVARARAQYSREHREGFWSDVEPPEA
jgi:hypothetical protein